MQPKHLMLAFVTVAVWGFNFVMIHVGLKEVPPLLLGALRFFFSAFPAVFLLPRPQVPWRLLIFYGMANFAAQFGFLFLAMHVGMPAGLASLLGQTQVFFSMFLGFFFFGDRPSPWKLTGALISFAGIAMVARHFQGGSLAGLFLSLLAAFSWGLGNMFSKRIRASSPLALVVWGNAVAVPAMVALSLAVEGPAAIFTSLAHFSLVSVVAVAYIVYVSTYVGYTLWTLLLLKYPTPTVVPFSLLVPVFGFLGAHLVLGEEFPPWKMAASFVVIAGLAFNLLEPQLRALLGLRRKPAQEQVGR